MFYNHSIKQASVYATFIFHKAYLSIFIRIDALLQRGYALTIQPTSKPILTSLGFRHAHLIQTKSKLALRYPTQATA